MPHPTRRNYSFPSKATRSPHISGKRRSRSHRLLSGRAGQSGRRRHRRGLAVGRRRAGHAEVVRSIVVTIRSLYDRQEHKFAGPYRDNRFLEDCIARVRDEPIGCVVLVARNAAGQAQHVVASYRPRRLGLGPAAADIDAAPLPVSLNRKTWQMSDSVRGRRRPRQARKVK
jgi:hypothetical protein